MNHRRNRGRRTSRHTGKRLENKSFRQHERASLRGDKPRSSKFVWTSTNYKDVVPGDPVGQAKPKRKKPIKYCPARQGNRRHAYMTDTYIGRGYNYWWESRSVIHLYEQKFKLCVYCGREERVGYPKYLD